MILSTVFKNPNAKRLISALQNGANVYPYNTFGGKALGTEVARGFHKTTITSKKNKKDDQKKPIPESTAIAQCH